MDFTVTLYTSNDAVLPNDVTFDGYKSEILYFIRKNTIVSMGEFLNCHNP